jgi:hypothetical protein
MSLAEAMPLSTLVILSGDRSDESKGPLLDRGPARACVGQGNAGANFGSAARARSDFTFSADQLHPLAHADQAKAG